VFIFEIRISKWAAGCRLLLLVAVILHAAYEKKKTATEQKIKHVVGGGRGRKSAVRDIDLDETHIVGCMLLLFLLLMLLLHIRHRF